MRLLALLLLSFAACTPADKPADTDTAAPEDTDSAAPVDADDDGYTADEDCDDGNADVHPGVAEVCNGIDDNCDDAVDEGVTTTWYADVDGDSYGDPGTASEACAPLQGFVATDDDCDDADATAYPGAVEVPADGVDQDCDAVDTCYTDADGDGYGTDVLVDGVGLGCDGAGEAVVSGDCDDANATLALDCSIGEEFTLGEDVEFSEASGHSPDYLLGSLIVVPDAMTVTDLAFIGKATGANVRMALYSDVGGVPDALVVEAPSTPVALGAVEIPVTATVLPAGDYWIMGIYDVTGSIGYDATDASAIVQYRSLSFSSALPDPFGTVSTYTGQRFNYYIVGY